MMSGYNALSRLITTTDPLTGTVVNQYDPVGNTLVVTSGSPSGALSVDTRQYDAQNEVITDTTSGPGTSPQTTTSAYDGDGNVEFTQAPDGDVTTNGYDFANQLRSVEIWPNGLPPSGGGSAAVYC